MKIDTDLVKNRIFNSAIVPSLLKHSNEYKVLAVLRYFYPEKYNTMIHSEAPDLQDPTNGIGIEVTNAVRESDLKASRLLSELRQDNPDDVEKKKMLIESLGYRFSSIDNVNAINATGTDDGDKLVFQSIIIKKLKKLQKYRIKFKKIGLAILLPEIPTSSAEENYMEWILEINKEANDNFDFFYFISYRFCIYYNIHNKTVTKRLIGKEEGRSLFTIARMTAEGELSLNDLEWQ